MLVKSRPTRLTLISVTLLLAALACNTPGQADSSALQTQVALSVQQTVNAAAAAPAGAGDSPATSQEPPAATQEPPAGSGAATAEPPQPTSESAELQAPTKTPEPTKPPNSGGCPDAAFVADVTIPDNTHVAPGAQFIKTWRFTNDGTCVLSGLLIPETSTAIGGPGIVFLPDNIQPGQEFEVSVRMIAPTSAGTYKEVWVFNDCLFCDKPTAFGPTPYVQIVVDPALADAGKGRIMGGIRYPAEGHPAMTIYAQKVNDPTVWAGVEVPGEGGGGYSLEVPPGKYYVYAYDRYPGGNPNPGAFGGYVAPIDFSGGTTTVTFLEVQVNAGDFRTGIDLDFFVSDPNTTIFVPADQFITFSDHLH